MEEIIERSLALGCSDAEAIRYLLLNNLERAQAQPLADNRFSVYDRALPTMNDYDRLLSGDEVGR